MIQRDAALVQKGITEELLQGIIEEYRRGWIPQMNQQRDYYDGRQAILSRTKSSGTSNNKLVINHAKYIVDLAGAYLIGSPVGYTLGDQAALKGLDEAYARCNVDSVDAELARHAGIYGKGVELLYLDGQGKPRTAATDPRYSFVVYDSTVAHAPLLGIHCTQRTDGAGHPVETDLAVYTDSRVLHYTLPQGGSRPVGQPREEAHFFGGVPLVEYWNNEDEQGDFRQVISLIDAYNLLMSDRVNDKEQLVDALLVIIGASLGGTDAEFSAAARKLRDEKIFELPGQDADAKYLTRQLNETDVQVLAGALSADIHKISMVPALTDEDFAGNASGVSLRYKLLGLEQLTKTKERWFREGLRSRMRLFAHVLALRGAPALDTDQVQLTFSRGLPANDLEQAQMISLLRGMVPDDMLLKQLSFIEDPEEAMKSLAEQKQQALRKQQAMFGQYADANQPPSPALSAPGDDRSEAVGGAQA